MMIAVRAPCAATKEGQVNQRRQLKRSNLFVLRIWTQDEDNFEGATKWEGQVTRAVDGEAHHFDDLQGLLDWLTHNLEGSTTTWGGNTGTDAPEAQAENGRRTR
jgi:hypothetical protein